MANTFRPLKISRAPHLANSYDIFEMYSDDVGVGIAMTIGDPDGSKAANIKRILESHADLLAACEAAYATVTRLLAEPGDDTGELVATATVLETAIAKGNL